MSTIRGEKKLGFFTRVLDQVGSGDRLRLALEQIVHAESFGYDSAWVAQHHFNPHEGGLPSPFVFLSHVAAHTQRIRLGTGIVTLPLENAVRVAEDAAVFDLLSGGRLELGVGSGGTPSAFATFGRNPADRSRDFAAGLRVLRQALAGEPLGRNRNRLSPPAPRLAEAIWQATFSPAGGTRAGRAGDGLLLSRTQQRSPRTPNLTLAEIQGPIVDAYLEALPAGVSPRISGARTVFVADDRRTALRFAEAGLRRAAAQFRAAGQIVLGDTLPELIAEFDVHLGTPEEVTASLSADPILERATDLVFQVHSVDPPHEYILRSIELIATQVAPALGWAPAIGSPAPALS
ncbi:putative FMN-dependent luciferase-like monooxygenase [Mycetocola sp. BIGb0189]|uniref:putative FMN-dependent luciferase-like monooxygenase n=1 Tax=Mycetocola sp. BIGb0189 TaxID=2940604 RepID=UPI00216A0B5E|nr:putative FMN-dependent luciferase-like monooxygenase [Mycetocola sp. BIGb0189]MCS4276426.1 putative FMN-dependent luciferase-like monooxygenase [Mycetocola sp. BIGb0189]